jgi:DNA primase
LWCGGRNDYVGIIGRTTIAEYSMLDIPKYFPLKAYPKGMNLYGLNENYKYIQEQNMIRVAEAEKSVLKRHSRNDRTCVAACSHDLSDEQVRILISLNIDITIAWDKDVSLQHIRATCNKFYGIRNVYYMYDKWDILGKKDSPADLPNKLYNFMFKYKIKYDEKEHREYLKGLK